MIFGKKAVASAGILFVLVAAGLIGAEYAYDSVDDYDSYDSGKYQAGRYHYQAPIYQGDLGTNGLTGDATRRSTRRATRTARIAIDQVNGAAQTAEIQTREQTSLTIHLGTFAQCNDKLKNGEETDVDCGGTQCPACDLAKVCVLDRDCKSTNCLDGKCGPELCEPGQNKCQIGPDGKQSGTIEFCTEARKGWQKGEKCLNGCTDGKCIPACTDSDGGTDIFEKGTTTGATSDNLLASQTQTDFCTGDTLSEYTCQKDSEGRVLLNKNDLKCENGCTDGACKQCANNIGADCNRNKCGGTGKVLCDGSCSAPSSAIPVKYGQDCNRNACGGTGTVKCDGTCSAAAISLTTTSEACNRNACGGTGTLTVTSCNGVRTTKGTCSANAPNVQYTTTACGCGGTRQDLWCDGKIRSYGSCTKTSCSSTQTCTNGQCVVKCTQAPSGMVNWWPADGNANDIKGGNNGVMHNSPGYANGKVGPAFGFDGVNDYISMGRPTVNSPGSFTMMFWGRPTKSITIQPQRVNGIYGLKTNQAYAIYPYWLGSPSAGAGISLGTNGVNIFEHSGNYLPAVLSHSQGISSSQYTHIALVYKNRVPQLFINGRYIKSGLVSGRTVYPSTAGFGGLSPDFATWTPFKGAMDEIQVYNRPLSTSEIQSVYNSGARGLCKSTTTTSCVSNVNQKCGCGGIVQCNGGCSKPSCLAGQTCNGWQCITTVSSTPIYIAPTRIERLIIPITTPTTPITSPTATDYCPGTAGCCCQYGYPDCASGYTCRGQYVSGHQTFGICTPSSSSYSSQLSSYEKAFCGK